MVPPERFHRPRDSARAGSLGQGTVIGILLSKTVFDLPAAGVACEGPERGFRRKKDAKGENTGIQEISFIVAASLFDWGCFVMVIE